MTNESYGIAMPNGSPLVAPVGTALNALIAAGAITALSDYFIWQVTGRPSGGQTPSVTTRTSGPRGA